MTGASVSLLGGPGPDTFTINQDAGPVSVDGLGGANQLNVSESGSAGAYRQRVSGPETVSMWQSLSFGANYKAAYCLSVCPAGEDVIGPYLADRRQFMEDTLKPLRQKSETIYVARGTDARGRGRGRDVQDEREIG